TYRTSTELVQVDVIVEDSKGRFVSTLTPNDFEVFEDGKRQKIETFSLVGAPAGTAETGAAQAPAGAAGAPAVQPGPTPTMAAGRRIFILVFDDRHLLPGAFKNVQRAAEQFINKEFTGSDVGGIVANGEMLGNRLTSDREELLADVRKLKPRASVMTQHYDLGDWPPLLSVEEAEQIVAGNQAALNEAVIRANQDMSQGRIPIDPTGAVMEKAQRIVTQAQVAANETLNTLSILMAGLAKFPGPKSVVFFSDGFFSDESWPGVQQVVGLAARARVRIYSVDARGLNLTSTNDTSLNPTTTIDGLGSLYAQMDAGSDGPNSLAVDTGGFVTRYTNNFVKALDQIADDGRTYYLIGYRPTNTDFNGKFRKISVKVTRPHLTVRARRGYLATPPPAVPTVATLTPIPETGRPGAPAQPAAPAAPTPAAPPAPQLVPDGPQHVEQLQQTERAGGTAATSGPTSSEAARATPSEGASVEAQRAWAFYQKGDLEGAATAFARAAAEPDAHPWVHYAYGLTEYGLSQFGDAIAQWEQVRAAAPDFEPVYFDLADGYLRSNNPQEALKILRTAAGRWPRDPQVFDAVGVIQVGLGVLDDAVKSFDHATKVAPDEGLGYFNLGKALELRYVRSKRYVSSTGAWTANDRDRRDAIAAFQRYVKIGGPFASSASQELLRLQYEGIAKQPR
ncbi:MAG TPA: VWA domain-containing protein, partial [Candidatus Saccharimonadales bacterium]|nr:VWA domain-containing protein [Candidatus Saccharimonadales bacterium]